MNANDHHPAECMLLGWGSSDHKMSVEMNLKVLGHPEIDSNCLSVFFGHHIVEYSVHSLFLGRAVKIVVRSTKFLPNRKVSNFYSKFLALRNFWYFRLEPESILREQMFADCSILNWVRLAESLIPPWVMSNWTDLEEYHASLNILHPS